MTNVIPSGIDSTTGQSKLLGTGDSLVNSAGTPLNALILVEKKDIAADTTTITFSGLNGNTDKIYWLEFNWVYGTTQTGNSFLFINPNGLTTSQGAESRRRN